MRKRVFSYIMAVFCLFVSIFAYSSSAEQVDYDARIRAIEEEAKRLQAESEAILGKIDGYKDDIAETDSMKRLVADAIAGIDQKIANQAQLINAKYEQIDAQIEQMRVLDQRIENTELQITVSIERISFLEAENDANLTRFGEIVRGMYMSGNYDMIELLMNSSDFFDLLIRAEVMRNVSEINMRFMRELNDSIDEQQSLIAGLEQKEASLVADKISAEEKRLLLTRELDALQEQKDAFDAELYASAVKLQDYTKQLNYMQDNVAYLKAQFTAAQADIEKANADVANLIREKQKAAAAANRPAYSPEGFAWPLDSNYHMITTYFGYDSWRSGNHYGIDVGNAGIGGANIYAAQSGTVITAWNDGNYHGGYGNYVVIDHGNGFSTLYAHGVTGGVVVKEGDEVVKGQVISHVGSTGFATGNHLHFEVRVDGNAVDPLNYGYEE